MGHSSQRSIDRPPGELFCRSLDGRRTNVPLVPESAAVHNERAAWLLADAKFREERRRRLVLERALADVCLDLHRLETQMPAAVEALRKIDALTNGIVPAD